MDTTWYAVDEHGHVGVFDTGEDGALPIGAATGMSPGDPNFDLRLLDLAQLATRLARGDDPLAARSEPWIAAGRTVVVVDPPAGEEESTTTPAWVQEAIEREELQLVRPGLPLLLLSYGALSEAEVRALAEREGVRWTIPLMDLGELTDPRIAPDGFFRFGRDHGDDPGRYACDQPPADPLRVDELMPQLAAALGRLQLAVDFRSGQPVHLADHEDVHAETWGDLPLRYSEAWHEEQRVLMARREADAQATQERGKKVLITVLVGLGVLIGWLAIR
jgi:hypothetical protein